MIKIEQLCKQFNSTIVLDELSLEIHTGETLVILGRSGVGKSVLLKLMIGMTKPDSGYIDIDGVRITDLNPPKIYPEIKHMGMLFQGSALFDSMNVFDNTSFYLREHKDPQTG